MEHNVKYYYKGDPDDMLEFRDRSLELLDAGMGYKVKYDQEDPLGEPVHIIED